MAWNGPTEVFYVRIPCIGPLIHYVCPSDLAWILPGKGRFWLSREGVQLPDTEWPAADTGGSLAVTGRPVSDKGGPLAAIRDPLAGPGGPLANTRGPLADTRGQAKWKARCMPL